MGRITNFRRAGRFFKPYIGKLFLSSGYTTLGTIFSLFSFTMVIPFLGILFGTQEAVHSYMPFSFSQEVLVNNFNCFLTNIIEQQGGESALGLVSIIIVFFVFLKTGFTYLGNYVLAPIRVGVVRDIRNYLYHKILYLQLSFFTDERKGDIMSRMTSDVQEVENSIMQAIKDGIKSPITIAIYFFSLVVMSVHLTLFVLVLLPTSAFIIGRIGKSLRRSSSKGQQKLGDILSQIEESLYGLSIIRAFNAEERFEKRFQAHNAQYSGIMKKIWRKQDLASPLSEYLSTCVIVIIMFYGGGKVLSGTIALSPQAFITYLIIFSQIITPAKAFSNAYYSVQRGLASFDRIRVIINTPITITEKKGAKSFVEFNDVLEYKDVCFHYSDKLILNKINLSISKGKTIALVGQSGAGKTTMVNLLPRFYDISEGSITIDGTDLRDLKIADLRDVMGVVTQDSILFNDTIFNNIAFGNNLVSHEQVVNAAKIANAHNFIMETENGYNTNIGDRGTKLSGGQRQRISIARAILKNPPILILDEATSALDTESEYFVQDAILKLMANRTSIVIAHRLSTINKADEIVVMDQGCIIERGTHEQLLMQKGAYSRLYNMQAFDK